jgi:uncharacterized protein (UPF0548 family)
MRFVSSRQPPGTSCASWTGQLPSSPPEGPPHARVDEYRAHVPVGDSGEISATFERVRRRLFAYDIFPPRRIQHSVCRGTEIATGATIVQRVVLGPLALEMAVRVVDAWNRTVDGAHEAGFTYVTLAGHAECGVSSFAVRAEGPQGLTVWIEARSCPGTVATRIGYPLARLFQRAITRAALRRLATLE